MTLLEPDVIEEEKLDDGDHDRLTHIVRKDKGDVRSAEAIVMESRVFGEPIRAYCGKQWVPTRDEKKYPVCPTCIEEWERQSGKTWQGRR